MANRADNVDTQSLRGFLKMVETDYPDQILRIRETVDPRFAMTSVVFELERVGKNPVVIFDKPAGFKIPVVTNVAGNRKLLAACLGVEPRTCRPHSASAARNTSRANWSTDAAWNEVVIEGDDVDLTKLPIPLQFTVDGAPYITAGQISARDPVTGVDTTGFHRLMLKGKNRLGVSLHSRRRMYEFHRRAEERGRVATRRDHDRDPSAALHGLDGLRLSTQCAEVRDYRRPFRRALPASRAAESSDLEVPAGAEIVIEGEILAGVREPEGPFGEFTGYASYRSTQNVFVAHRVRMRPTPCSIASRQACLRTTSWCPASPARARS